jgi:methionine-rich copper-binding protein CopC
MKTSRIALLAAALVPGLAMAHAHLLVTVPVDKSVILAMPAQVSLQFTEAVRITALSIEKKGGKDKVVLKAPADARATVHADAPKLKAGAYLLNWRGLSDDGHVTSGTVHFTVTGK